MPNDNISSQKPRSAACPSSSAPVFHTHTVQCMSDRKKLCLIADRFTLPYDVEASRTHANLENNLRRFRKEISCYFAEKLHCRWVRYTTRRYSQSRCRWPWFLCTTYTDNEMHWTMCGRVGTKLTNSRRHEIPEVWRVGGSTSADIWRHTLGMSTVLDDAAAASRLPSEDKGSLRLWSSDLQVRSCRLHVIVFLNFLVEYVAIRDSDAKFANFSVN